jgi:hypothetical protein
MRKQYFALESDIEGCLKNGSFVRKSKYGLAQYMNGDFMGFLSEVPKRMIEVPVKKAEHLIPVSCGGKR